MRIEDVDVRFFPSEAVSENEIRDWRRIIAGAAADTHGAASLAFMRIDSSWLLLGLYRRDSSGETPTPVLRRRILEALRAAGKPLIEG
jgi:hypothetical protein